MKAFTSTSATTHRGKRFLVIMLTDSETETVSNVIDGVPYCILQMADMTWILGPQRVIDEPHYADFGPFDTAERAYAQLRLLGS